MAGVEVITLVGLAAGVGQLIDYGQKFSSIVQDGRDAFVSARKLSAEAQNVLELARSIHDGFRHYEHMRPFLEVCIHESEELKKIAGTFIAYSTLHHSQGILRRIHSVLVWEKKHEQIRRHLDTIEHNKTSLFRSSFADLSEDDSDQFSDLMLKVSTTELELETAERTTTGAYNTLPDFPDRLLGFDRYLDQLYTISSGRRTQTRVFITGLSGIGMIEVSARKSCLALEYARLADPKISVFWIRASQEQTLVHSYMEIAAITGLSQQSSNQSQLIRDVVSFLESPGMASLLIYDDLGDSHNWSRSLEDYLPRNQLCQAIFTVRDPKHGSLLRSPDSVINLQGLEPDAALQLLLANLTLEDGVTINDARNFVLALGFIPLAILEAASFMSSNEIAVKDYLSLLLEGSGQARGLSCGHTSHRIYDSTPESFFDSFSQSLQSLKVQDALAFNILGLMSCISSSAIPSSFLVDGLDGYSPIKATTLLRDLSLIELDDESPTSYGISPFLQHLVRDHLICIRQYKDYLNLALERILMYFPVTSRDSEGFATGSKYLFHAEMLLKQGRHFGNDSHSSLRELSTRVTSFLLEKGSLAVAGIYAEKALRFSELAFEPDIRRSLKAKSDVAMILSRTGKLHEAEDMTRRLLDRQTVLFGFEDLDTLASLNNLATILRARGCHEDAEIWYRKTVKMHQREDGSESSDLMQAMENLALTLKDKGEYAEANKLFQRVLIWRTQHFGASDNRTVVTKSNLGTLRQLESQWEEAWTLQTEAFRSYAEHFGRMHPQTIKIQANLAIIMHRQGYLKAAEPLMRQAAEHLQMVLGLDDPDTLIAMRNLAELLCHLEQYDEALEVSWKTWNNSRKRFGPRHPETLKSKRQNKEIECLQRNFGRDSDLD